VVLLAGFFVSVIADFLPPPRVVIGTTPHARCGPMTCASPFLTGQVLAASSSRNCGRAVVRGGGAARRMARDRGGGLATSARGLSQFGGFTDGREVWLVANLGTGLDVLQEQCSCLQVSVKKVYPRAVWLPRLVVLPPPRSRWSGLVSA